MHSLIISLCNYKAQQTQARYKELIRTLSHTTKWKRKRKAPRIVNLQNEIIKVVAEKEKNCVDMAIGIIR